MEALESKKRLAKTEIQKKQKREKQRLEIKQKKELERQDSSGSNSSGAIDFNEVIAKIRAKKLEIDKGEMAENSVLPESTIKFLSVFQKEILLLMRLDHPNVIKMHQIIDSPSETFVVMYLKFTRDLAHGGELADFITTNGKLTEKESRRLFRQLVSAVDHVHSANIVHRDLKLENILLDRNRNVLLTDFGLGRTYEGNQLMMVLCFNARHIVVPQIFQLPK